MPKGKRNNPGRANMRVPNPPGRKRNVVESEYLRPAQVDAMAELFIQELVPTLVEAIKPHLVKLYDQTYGEGFQDATEEADLNHDE